MDPYFIEIIRDSLTEYGGRVSDEEVGAAKFVENRVTVLDNKVTNLATFLPLEPGTIPTTAYFVPYGQLPSGKAADWNGVILVDGKNVAASMYR